VGRPRRLTYQRQLEIYVAWWGALNAHAVHVHDRKRDRAVAKLQTRFRTLSAAGTPTHEITNAIDKIGRVSRVPIEPPPTCYPVLDRAIGVQFGISPRMVRRIRADHRLKKFKPHPAWHERPWEKPAREAFQAQQVAKRLMTPERYAKGEAIVLEGGRLVVLDTAGRLNQQGLLSDADLHRYRDYERRARKAGIPFKTGTELEIISGPAPRYGCENLRGEPTTYPVDHRDGALRRWNDRRDRPPHQWALWALDRLPEPPTPVTFVPYSPPAIFIPQSHDRRFTLPPEPVPLPLGKWKGPLGKRARPEDLDRVVLGPHSMWPYMDTSLFQPRYGEEAAVWRWPEDFLTSNTTMRRQIRALRVWLEAEEDFGQKTEAEARCGIMKVESPPK
jgi:hypothetical protein